MQVRKTSVFYEFREVTSMERQGCQNAEAASTGRRGDDAGGSWGQSFTPEGISTERLSRWQQVIVDILHL